MNPKDHLNLTREELYDLVWAKPMTEVGQAFHVSDRAIAKLCVKKQVPFPPRGYWAKKKAGKYTPKPSLPEVVANSITDRKSRVTPSGQTSAMPKFCSVADERKEIIKKALNAFRKPLSEAVDYKVRIEKWRCDYSFGLNPLYDPLHYDAGASFLHGAPYSEHRDLFLYGVFLEPKRLKQRKFQALISRQLYLDEKVIEKYLHEYEETPPKSVGAFMRQNDATLAILFIPDDAFMLILQNAAANKINFMTLRGEILRYGRGNIFAYSFLEEQDE